MKHAGNIAAFQGAIIACAVGFSAVGAAMPLHAAGLSAGAPVPVGSPVEKLVEYLGEPSQRLGGFGCDCSGGCRTEEQLYYRHDDLSYTVTVIDGVVSRIE